MANGLNILGGIAGGVTQGLQLSNQLEDLRLRKQQASQDQVIQGLKIKQAEAGLQAQAAQSAAAQKQAKRDAAIENLTSVAQGAEAALGLSGQDRVNFVNNRLVELSKQGRNTAETQMIQESIKQYGPDSPEVDKILSDAMRTANSFGIYTEQQQLKRQVEAQRQANQLKSIGDIRKETRGRIGTEVKNISKVATEIESNYSKLDGLISEIDKGNRTSVGPALVAVTKLGDPGSTVSIPEMEAMLNNQLPLAALADKGVSSQTIESIQRMMDPLNPGFIKTDELRAVADALIAANVPTLQSRYEEQRGLAESNLTKTGMDSIFSKGLEERVSKLSKLVKKQAGFGNLNEQQKGIVDQLQKLGATDEEIQTALRGQ